MRAVSLRVSGSEILASPKCKPSTAPLGYDSSHPPGVHARWPTAYAMNLPALCSRGSEAMAHQLIFISRLEAFSTPTPLVRRVLKAVEAAPRSSSVAARPNQSNWCVLSLHGSFDVGGWRRAVVADTCFRSHFGSSEHVSSTVWLQLHTAGIAFEESRR